MERMRTNEPQNSLLRRIFTSKTLLMLIFVVLIAGVMYLSTAGLSGQVQDNQAQFLSDAVRRSAVQCYVLEGHYPHTLSYLEENYGLIIDRNRYAVYYESMGSNILPQIRVVVISG